MFDARASDVALVLVGGMVRLGDECFAGLFERQAVPMESLVVGGVRKLVATPLGSVAARACALTPECARILP